MASTRRTGDRNRDKGKRLPYIRISGKGKDCECPYCKGSCRWKKPANIKCTQCGKRFEYSNSDGTWLFPSDAKNGEKGEVLKEKEEEITTLKEPIQTLQATSESATIAHSEGDNVNGEIMKEQDAEMAALKKENQGLKVKLAQAAKESKLLEANHAAALETIRAQLKKEHAAALEEIKSTHQLAMDDAQSQGEARLVAEVQKVRNKERDDVTKEVESRMREELGVELAKAQQVEEVLKDAHAKEMEKLRETLTKEMLANAKGRCAEQLERRNGELNAQHEGQTEEPGSSPTAEARRVQAGAEQWRPSEVERITNGLELGTRTLTADPEQGKQNHKAESDRLRSEEDAKLFSEGEGKADAKPLPAVARLRASAAFVSSAARPPPGGLEVRMIAGPHSEAKYLLRPRLGAPCFLGRSEGKKFARYGVSLHKDPEVSTTHGKFVAEVGGLGAGAPRFYFMDVGSANGTFHDGEALEPNERLPLEDGTELEVGLSVLKVVLG